MSPESLCKTDKVKVRVKVGEVVVGAGVVMEATEVSKSHRTLTRGVPRVRGRLSQMCVESVEIVPIRAVQKIAQPMAGSVTSVIK